MANQRSGQVARFENSVAFSITREYQAAVRMPPRRRRAVSSCALLSAVLFSLGAMSTSAQPTAGSPSSPVQVTERALRLHRSALVFDGHNDFPWELRQHGASSFDKFDISKSVTNFQTDIPRLRQGGVGAQFF